jgi:hypothetical protein
VVDDDIASAELEGNVVDVLAVSELKGIVVDDLAVAVYSVSVEVLTGSK